MRTKTLVTQGKDIAVLDLVCAAAASDDGRSCSFGFQGFDGLRALAWTKDERAFFVIENEKNLAKLLIPQQAIQDTRVDERKQVSQQVATTMVVRGPTPYNTVQEESALLEISSKAANKSLKESDVPLATYLRGSNDLATIAFDSSLSLSVFQKSDFRPVGLKAPEATSAKLVFAGDGKAVFTDIGLSDSPSQTLSAFTKPLWSVTDGGWIGSFSRVQVSTEKQTPQSELLKQHISAVLGRHPAFWLEDLSVNQSYDYAYVLKNSTGARSYGVKHGSHAFQHDCSNAGAPQTQRPSTPAYVSTVELGTPERPLAALKFEQSSSRGLAVIFGGGPAGTSLLKPENLGSVRAFLADQFDVLVVGYSSTLGSGVKLASRIRTDGLVSLERDAQAVSDYLQRAHPASRPLVIFGESFGAVPATSLSGKAITIPHRLVLVAPFLRHQQPKDWVEKIKGPLLGVTAQSQANFEDALFGGAVRDEPKFQQFLDSVYLGRSAQTPTFVAFAKDDPLSQGPDLPKNWSGSTTTYIVPGNHSFVTSQPQLWPTITHWLKGQP